MHAKLDEKSRLCIFVGYSNESKGYRLFDPAAKPPHNIIISQNVIFLEDKTVDFNDVSESHPRDLPFSLPMDIFTEDTSSDRQEPAPSAPSSIIHQRFSN